MCHEHAARRSREAVESRWLRELWQRQRDDEAALNADPAPVVAATADERDPLGARSLERV